jgi:mono/diheme cytochrome c family protein
MTKTTLVAAATATLLFVGEAHAAEGDLGARLFFNHCAACHGDAAEGGGPAAAAMRVTVPNLRTLATRNDGAFPAEAVRAYIDGRESVAAHGDRQMPVWGDVFRGPEQGTSERTVRRRIDALVEFIATLQYR